MSFETTIKTARFATFTAPREPAAPFPRSRTPAEEARAARETARTEGYERGVEEGRAAAVADWTQRLTVLAGVLEDTTRTVRALAAELERAVPPAVVVLARKVIESELTAGEDALRATVARVARRVAGAGAIAVRVAPDVAEALAALARDDGATRLGDVAVHADASLGRGDWVVETEAGFLDGRLATQLGEAWRALTEPDA